MGGKKKLIFGVLLLLMVAAANRLWFMLNLPATAIEADLIAGLSRPSGHLLFSLFAKMFVGIGLSDLMAVRSVALVASLASALVLFAMVLREHSARFAFFSAGVWIASLGGIVSGFVGSGHSLVVLFTLSAFYALMRMRDTEGREMAWRMAVRISCALGFLSSPMFLIPFVGIFVGEAFYQLRRQEGMRFLLRASGLLSGAAAGILLLWFFSGRDFYWLPRGIDLGGLSVRALGDHTQLVLANIDPLVVGIFIPMAIVALMRRRDWRGGLMAQAVIMVLVSIGYVAVSGSLPAAHKLVFLVPFVVMAVSEGLFNGYHQVSQLFRRGMMVLIALLPVLVLVNGNRAVKDAVGLSSTESAPLPPEIDPISQD
jgi:hypothetical protein